MIENYLTNVDVFRQLDSVEIPNLSGKSLLLLTEQMIQISFKYAKLIRSGLELYEERITGFQFDEELKGPAIAISDDSDNTKAAITSQGYGYQCALASQGIDEGEVVSWAVKLTNTNPQTYATVY